MRYKFGVIEVIMRLIVPPKTPENANFLAPNTVINAELSGQDPTVKPNTREPINPEKENNVLNLRMLVHFGNQVKICLVLVSDCCQSTKIIFSRNIRQTETN